MFMIKKSFYILSVAIAALLSSCIKNDIPYPHETTVFEYIEAENQISANIDAKNQTVTFTFPETQDLAKVRIKDYVISEGAELRSPDLRNTIDLNKDVTVILYKYYEYEWTFKAKQEIEREFNVRNQIGATTIDPVGHRVIVNIPQTEDITKVQVLSVKLGPKDVTKYSADLTASLVDASNPIPLDVTYFGKTENWTIFIVPTETLVTTERADAWTNVIWVYGQGQVARENGFEYRAKGAEEWVKVPTDWITYDGGAFVGCIRHLQPMTTFEVRAYSGEDYGAVLEATTEGYLPLPNNSFDDWNCPDGKTWEPWKLGDDSFWDTGNDGSTTLGESITIPTDDTCNGKGQAAKLQTKFVGISVVGKLGAGNIYTGEYIRTDGTNGVLNFGREFTGRPVKLHGSFKYDCVDINYANAEKQYALGQPDTAMIYVALTDWPEPYEIRTNPRNRQLFDVNDSHIIAYGEMYVGHSVKNWTEFDVEFKYRATNRKPRYILIVCSASKYGDFFTGGDGSTMYVDEFSLKWDY